MTTPPALSPAQAAAEAPDRVALLLPDRVVRWGELPAIVRAHEAAVRGAPWVTCVATPTFETFALLWTALAHGVPFVPLHPRLPEAERDALRASLARTPPPPGTAAVIWTSGTSGAPRGVCLSGDNLVAAAAASAANLGWRDDDRWLCALPLAHVGGLTIPVRALLARRAVVALPRFDETTVLSTVRGAGVTLASFVPTMLARLLAADADGALATLRAILLGGDAAPPALLAICRARGLRVLCSYGLTEAGGQVATQRPGAPVDPAQGVGAPLPGVEVRIAEGGRIEVRGPSVARTFLGEPTRAADAWLDTGDLGALDEAGHLHVTGRAKDLIVTGGENVSPARVEAVLGACPGVQAALVFGLPDATWGQLVCAALVAGPDRPPDASVLAHAAACLAPHERPRRLFWVDALPMTSAGKLARLTGRPRTPPAPPPGRRAAGTTGGRP